VLGRALIETATCPTSQRTSTTAAFSAASLKRFEALPAIPKGTMAAQAATLTLLLPTSEARAVADHPAVAPLFPHLEVPEGDALKSFMKVVFVDPTPLPRDGEPTTPRTGELFFTQVRSALTLVGINYSDVLSLKNGYTT